MKSFQTLLVLISLLSICFYTIFQNEDFPNNKLSATSHCSREVVQQCMATVSHHSRRLYAQNLFKISGQCAESVSKYDCMKKLNDVKSHTNKMLYYINRGQFHQSYLIGNQMWDICQDVDDIC